MLQKIKIKENPTQPQQGRDDADDDEPTVWRQEKYFNLFLMKMQRYPLYTYRDLYSVLILLFLRLWVVLIYNFLFLATLWTRALWCGSPVRPISGSSLSFG